MSDLIWESGPETDVYKVQVDNGGYTLHVRYKRADGPWLSRSEAIEIAKAILDDNKFDVDALTRRELEILPCPNPECGSRNIYGELPHFEEDGCGNFRVACNCGYRGPLHATREGAIRIHNLIAENIQRKEE